MEPSSSSSLSNEPGTAHDLLLSDLFVCRTADDEVSVDGDDDNGQGGHEHSNAGQGLHQPKV
jgi:hypothetical protein